jgi:hypothetical protein
LGLAATTIASSRIFFFDVDDEVVSSTNVFIFN